MPECVGAGRLVGTAPGAHDGALHVPTTALTERAGSFGDANAAVAHDGALPVPTTALAGSFGDANATVAHDDPTAAASSVGKPTALRTPLPSSYEGAVGRRPLGQSTAGSSGSGRGAGGPLDALCDALAGLDSEGNDAAQLCAVDSERMANALRDGAQDGVQHVAQHVAQHIAQDGAPGAPPTGASDALSWAAGLASALAEVDAEGRLPNRDAQGRLPNKDPSYGLSAATCTGTAEAASPTVGWGAVPSASTATAPSLASQLTGTGGAVVGTTAPAAVAAFAEGSAGAVQTTPQGTAIVGTVQTTPQGTAVVGNAAAALSDAPVPAADSSAYDVAAAAAESGEGAPNDALGVGESLRTSAPAGLPQLEVTISPDLPHLEDAPDAPEDALRDFLRSRQLRQLRAPRAEEELGNPLLGTTLLGNPLLGNPQLPRPKLGGAVDGILDALSSPINGGSSRNTAISASVVSNYFGGKGSPGASEATEGSVPRGIITTSSEMAQLTVRLVEIVGTERRENTDSADSPDERRRSSPVLGTTLLGNPQDERRRSSHGSKSHHTVYQLRARVGPFESTTFRRFSEFLELHQVGL